MNYRHIHFIGVGGIGVSGLAKLMSAKGFSVSGSDAFQSVLTEEVAALGIPVKIGHRTKNLPAAADLVVYSEAVPAENPERLEAARRKTRVLAAAEFIGEFTRDKKTVTVSGTNGKSTTTAMLGLILEAAGLDPTVIVGSKVPNFPLGSVRAGKSDLVVLEADEYRAKYLNYHPSMIVLTNIEEDHLDFYTGLPEIAETFDRYLTNLKAGGTVVLNADDPVSGELHLPERVVKYSLLEKEADFSARNFVVQNGRQSFEVLSGGQSLGKFTLKIPARYNVANALAAIAAAVNLDVSVKVIREILANFSGIWRRFEFVGEWRGATVISDYGHHPTAVRGTIAAAREFFPGRRVVLVFEPHQHNRTRRLFDDFAAAIKTADAAIITEVYEVAGREDGERVSADELATACGIKEVIAGGSLDTTLAAVEKIAQPDDVIIFMGAGDIDTLSRRICRK